MKLFRDEAGQTLVFTALLMCCLIGFMALAVDVSVLIRAQRKIQTAADAAAIAGTLEYFYHGTSNAAAVAKTAATNNGITDTNQVTVNIPPVNGWHTGTSYLEVIIKQPNPTIFMGAFAGLFPGGSTSNYNPMNVGARAVGGIVPGAACVYILDPSNPGAVTLKGGSTVTSPQCVWQVDSTSQQALCITGNNANVSFDSPGVILATGQSTQGNCNKLYPGATTGGTSLSDPLASLVTFPKPSDVCTPGVNEFTGDTVTNSTTLTTSTTQIGGYSTDANKLSYKVVCFKAASGGPTTLSNVNLNSDPNTLYLFEQGLVLAGTNTVDGTIDLNSGMFCQGTYSTSTGKCSWNSGGGLPSITINAPDSTTGPAWNGLAFVMPGGSTPNTQSYCDNSYGGPNYGPSLMPDSCLQMQFGSGSGQLNGMIYAPDSALYIQDSGGTGIGVTNLIVDTIFVNGTLNITDSYNYVHPDSPLDHVALVE